MNSSDMDIRQTMKEILGVTITEKMYMAKYAIITSLLILWPFATPIYPSSMSGNILVFLVNFVTSTFLLLISYVLFTEKVRLYLLISREPRFEQSMSNRPLSDGKISTMICGLQDESVYFAIGLFNCIYIINYLFLMNYMLIPYHLSSHYNYVLSTVIPTSSMCVFAYFI